MTIINNRLHKYFKKNPFIKHSNSSQAFYLELLKQPHLFPNLCKCFHITCSYLHLTHHPGKRCGCFNDLRRSPSKVVLPIVKNQLSWNKYTVLILYIIVVGNIMLPVLSKIGKNRHFLRSHLSMKLKPISWPLELVNLPSCLSCQIVMMMRKIKLFPICS